MKTFSPDFFASSNFIKDVQTFDYGPTGKQNHICYNINDGYFYILGASIISVLENNKDLHFTFHIFTDGYSKENAAKVATIARQWHCKCILYTFKMEQFQDFHIKVARFSRITYGRIYMPKVLQKLTKRFLYLDADTICLGSLQGLLNYDLQGKAIGCVLEAEDVVEPFCKFAKLKNHIYFNDGVMLVDVAEWEKERITERAFAYQLEPKEHFKGQSQDVLNRTFDGDLCLLPLKFNSVGGGCHDEGDAVIVHWTGRMKPWQMVLTKFDKKWRKYNALSPWETITNILPIKEPQNYHDFEQRGRYQKAHGNEKGYLQGMFWYGLLRTRYKLKEGEKKLLHLPKK